MFNLKGAKGDKCELGPYPCDVVFFFLSFSFRILICVSAGIKGEDIITVSSKQRGGSLTSTDSKQHLREGSNFG